MSGTAYWQPLGYTFHDTEKYRKEHFCHIIKSLSNS